MIDGSMVGPSYSALSGRSTTCNRSHANDSVHRVRVDSLEKREGMHPKGCRWLYYALYQLVDIGALVNIGHVRSSRGAQQYRGGLVEECNGGIEGGRLPQYIKAHGAIDDSMDAPFGF